MLGCGRLPEPHPALHCAPLGSESRAMSPCLLLTALNPVSGGHTFLPEDVGVPGQHRLQQHWHITLWVIAAQVVLQLSATKRDRV